MPQTFLGNTNVFVAHTPSKANPHWHGLADHALAVTDLAVQFAKPFGGETLARYVGLLHEGKSVLLTEEGRKIVLGAYQARKAEDVPHELLKEKPPFGLLPHLQARLLARYLRGDMETYLPFQS